MRMGLIDAGGANLGSVRYALERLGVTVQTVREAAHLQDVDGLILPGVGSAAEGMRRLNAQGLTTPLRGWRRPLLGICLGMQLFYEASDEGDVPGLGLLTGRVRQMTPSPGIRMPQMGWNRVHASVPCALLDDIDDGARMYFVHGYAAPISPATRAICIHGEAFSAVVESGRTFGVQFHPERSGSAGAQLLRNFIGLHA